MRRPPHGATSRPGPARPGNGYGRPLRVCPAANLGGTVEVGFWLERELEFELADARSNKPARDDLVGTIREARTLRASRREPRREQHRAPDHA